MVGATGACRPATPPLRAVRAKCRGNERTVTPGQPLGFPRGSRRVVVIAVRAAWRPLPLLASAAAPGSGPARRGAWPAASPARRSDRACRAEVGRSRRSKWGKRMTLGGRSRVCALIRFVPKGDPKGGGGVNTSRYQGAFKSENIKGRPPQAPRLTASRFWL